MRSWLKDGTAKKMTPVEAAWLAGFFDGEGSLVSYKSGRKRTGRAFKMQIANTDLRSIKRCLAITGVGGVGHRYKNHPRWKYQEIWYVNAQRDLVDVLKQIRPYLIIKGDVVDKFLDKWKEV